ncbi:MAG: xanthine dehydrogenase family protein subunit M [Chloroflexi bacterium]|nr:xanthine dehydrogenase family protein subunit M [Chloroflexota bacterium]
MLRFEVLHPHDLADAFDMLTQHEGEAKIIAGGQGLMPVLKHRQLTPRQLVNIRNLSDLDYIVDGKDGLRIGALTTHQAVENSAIIKKRWPVLAEMEARLGDIQTRNWGTLVGNVCQASPTGDPAPVLLALGACLKVASNRGERLIALDDFFLDYQKTALKGVEIALEIQVPKQPARSGAAYHKESYRWTDSPIASVAAAVTLDERDRVKGARIFMQAVCPAPIRARQAEDLLAGQQVNNGLLDQVAQATAGVACPISDVYGTAEYKMEMVKVITRQVVSQAIKQAQAA